MSSQNISNEIVYRVAKDAEDSPTAYVFMALSGVLAAVALLTDSIPILIGAMIVAPAFPPLALIVFAFAGGQSNLAWSGLKSGVMRISLAIAFAMLTTYLFNILELIPKEMNLVRRPLLEERVRVGWYSGVAGLAAGLAGAIAVIQGRKDSLIGILTALALVPAGAAGGIALLSGDKHRALGGFLLLVMNVLLILGSTLLTILVMRPIEDDAAAKSGNDLNKVQGRGDKIT